MNGCLCKTAGEKVFFLVLFVSCRAGSEKRGIHRELEKKKSRERKENRDMKETCWCWG